MISRYCEAIVRKMATLWAMQLTPFFGKGSAYHRMGQVREVLSTDRLKIRRTSRLADFPYSLRVAYQGSIRQKF